MHIIDTHTHIYLPEFEDDRKEVLARARQAGVTTMILPAIDSSTHQKMLQIESENEGLFAMIGLHPCSVNQNHRDELDLVRGYLGQRKFIAVGEIGLDFYWDKSFTNQQYEAFHEQIKMALEFQLPIAIHSRNATDECIEVVRKYPGLRGVFHCFSGDQEQGNKIIDCGFMLGIGGVVTFKNAGLDKVIGAIGIDHVVLETDAPYLAPVPFRGKRNEPFYTTLVAEKIATICNRSIDEVVAVTTENAKNLFKL